MPVFHVTKSIVIDVPVDQVYASVRDFRQWQIWSPWLLSEPGCEPAYADDGESYSWSAGMMHGQAKVFAKDKKFEPYEVYENSPKEVPENELVTVVKLGVK